jgi:RNase P subunit RPR2
MIPLCADRRDPSAKRNTCNGCSTVLIPGLTAKVRNRRKLATILKAQELTNSKQIPYERITHDLPIMQHSVHDATPTYLHVGRANRRSKES